MKKIALISVYNEEKTLFNVINETKKYVDEIIIIDDCSTDLSYEVIKKFINDNNTNLYCIKHSKQKGAAQSLKTGFMHIADRLAKNEIKKNHLIITLDSDGQHIPADIEKFIHLHKKYGYEHILGKRDFIHYPRWKIFGNKIMSNIASFLTKRKFYDVECGFRLLKAELIPSILKYYDGIKYSNGQEIAIISSLCGHKIYNKCPIYIPFYRKNSTTIFDGVIAAIQGLKITFRIYFKNKNNIGKDVGYEEEKMANY